MNLNAPKIQVREELRRRWTAQAVELAMKGSWDEAVAVNLQVLQVFPNDVPARNRLGKAYYELGRQEEALDAYEENLKLEPSNSIARKRLAELYVLLNREPEGEDASDAETAEGE